MAWQQRLTLQRPVDQQRAGTVAGLVEPLVASLLQHANEQVEAQPGGPDEHHVALQPLRTALLAGPLEAQVGQRQKRGRA